MGQAQSKIKPDLDALVRERKSKLKAKTEQRRLEEKELILRLNRKNDDGISPLKLLPREMWKHLFSYLNDPQDLQSVEGTCILFRDIIECRRLTDILFPLMLGAEKTSCEPETLYYLLPLRKVCKSFRNHIDKHFANELEAVYMFRRSCFSSCANFLPLQITISNKITNNKKFKRFVKYYTRKLNPLKRFPKQAVQIFMEYKPGLRNGGNLLRNFQQSEDLLLKLLKKVGNQVIIFEFSIAVDGILENGLTLTKIYLFIRKCIAQLPNLKYLEIVFIPSSITFLEYDTSTLVTPEDIISIRRRPFPYLRKLQRLDIFFPPRDCNIPIIFETILRSNQHLEGLQVSGSFNENVGGLLGMISSLELNFLSVRLIDETSDPWSDLRNVVNTSWNLKELHLYFKASSISQLRLFRFIEQFQKLEKLGLNLDGVNMLESKGDLMLQLPKLEEYSFDYLSPSHEKIVSPEMSLSIGYLILSENLKRIKFDHEYIYEAKDMEKALKLVENETIQFRGGQMDLRSSNLWDIFPFLEEIEVRSQVDETNGNLYDKISSRYDVIRHYDYFDYNDDIYYENTDNDEEDQVEVEMGRSYISFVLSFVISLIVCFLYDYDLLYFF